MKVWVFRKLHLYLYLNFAVKCEDINMRNDVEDQTPDRQHTCAGRHLRARMSPLRSTTRTTLKGDLLKRFALESEP